MASRLDKVTGILVRVPTPDTRYGSEYTFTKPSTSTRFMYYYYQLQYLNWILTLFAGAHLQLSWKFTKELLCEKMVFNTLSQKSATAGDNRASNAPPISNATASLKPRNKVRSNKRGYLYPQRISSKNEVLQTHSHRKTLSWWSLCPQTGKTLVQS